MCEITQIGVNFNICAQSCVKNHNQKISRKKSKKTILYFLLVSRNLQRAIHDSFVFTLPFVDPNLLKS